MKKGIKKLSTSSAILLFITVWLVHDGPVNTILETGMSFTQRLSVAQPNELKYKLVIQADYKLTKSQGFRPLQSDSIS